MCVKRNHLLHSTTFGRYASDIPMTPCTWIASLSATWNSSNLPAAWTNRRALRPIPCLESWTRTVTAMGSRLLREWLLRPLVTCSSIDARLTAVDELKTQLDARVHLRSALRPVQDISRLSSRISLGVANPRDLLALTVSLASLPVVHTGLAALSAPLLTDLSTTWDNAQDLYELIERAIAARRTYFGARRQHPEGRLSFGSG